jgi:N4-gp56 family major capsid protein
MADRNTSTTTGDNLLMVLFSRKAIKTLHEKVGFYQLCEKFPLPPGSGTQMTFNGWRPIAAASSTLAEASSNHAVNLSSRKVNVTINSYGRHVKITDLAEMVSIIGPMEGAVRELTHSAALTLDNVIQRAVFKNVLAQVGQNADVKTKLLSGAIQAALASAYCANTGTFAGNQFGFPVVFGTSATRLSAGTAASISSLPGPIGVRKAVSRLKRLSVEPMSNGKYVAIAHPNWVSGLYSNSDYKTYVVNYAEGPKESYFKSSPSHTIHGVEIVESANVPRYATSALSCTPLFICGQGALGVVELGGGTEIIIKRPGASSTDNPYDLFMTVSYKMRTVAAALNPSAGVILLNSKERL